MKRIIGITFILLLCNILQIAPIHAQGSYSPALPDVIPASPVSRIFQKFAGYPISHATGTIDVQIPVYTLNVHGWSAPFTLKYHSSGVRVQDPIGVVGRNWALFPGFKISRTVMSKPDDIYPVTDINNDFSVDNQMRIASPYQDCECRTDLGIDLKRMDGQYDIFQVNMPGMSSSFVLQRIDGKDVVKPMADTPLKITLKQDNSTNFINDNLYGFEIQDDKGIRYIFGESAPLHGAKARYLESASGVQALCGWMLREVVFPGGNKITFTYQAVTELVGLFDRTVTLLDNGEKKPLVGCYYNDMVNTSTGATSPYWRFLGNQGYQQVTGYGVPVYTNTSLVPVTITAPDETINFTYEHEMLKSVDVKLKNGNAIKRIQFLYDTNRALLKKVDMTGEGCYDLLYKNEGGMKNSGFDWWGFYNGTSSYNSYLPSIKLKVHATRGSVGVNIDVNIGDDADRDPVAAYMDTYSLTEIVSPTRGRLNINYEPHQFNVGGVSRIGEGIRVKSTELYDPVSGKSVVKNYTYEDAHYSDYDYPDQKSLVSTGYLCALDDGSCMVRQRTLSAFSSYANLRNLIRVWYGKVTEATSEWKKVYVYDFKPDVYDTTASDNHSPDYSLNIEYLLTRQNSSLYTAPWLLSETSYRKTATGYEKIQAISNTYTGRVDYLSGMIAVPYLYPYNDRSTCEFMDETLHCSSHRYVDVFGSPVRYARYDIAFGYHNLASTRKVTYAATNDSIVDEVTYAYNAARSYNVSQKTTLLSGGDKLMEKYYYSNNTIPGKSNLSTAQQEAIALLTSSNYLTAPVQIVQEKNGTPLYSVLKGYKSLSTVKMAVQDEYYQKGTGAFEKRLTCRNYDSYGNLVCVDKDHYEQVVYIWGYQGQYLVAEIKGSTYDNVKSALGGLTPEMLSMFVTPRMDLINGLRSKLDAALITTYTYSPAIGIASVTAPNGETTTYEYDASARLSKVKDHNGKVIEQYDYHYQP